VSLVGGLITFILMYVTLVWMLDGANEDFAAPLALIWNAVSNQSRA
jgi:hypothetical protein